MEEKLTVNDVQRHIIRFSFFNADAPTKKFEKMCVVFFFSELKGDELLLHYRFVKRPLEMWFL